MVGTRFCWSAKDGTCIWWCLVGGGGGGGGGGGVCCFYFMPKSLFIFVFNMLELIRGKCFSF